MRMMTAAPSRAGRARARARELAGNSGFGMAQGKALAGSSGVELRCASAAPSRRCWHVRGRAAAAAASARRRGLRVGQKAGMEACAGGLRAHTRGDRGSGEEVWENREAPTDFCLKIN